jgi:hypothetical protein
VPDAPLPNRRRSAAIVLIVAAAVLATALAWSGESLQSVLRQMF